MKDDFFIGWQKRPPSRFLLGVAAALLMALAGLALALGRADDPAGPALATAGGFSLPESMDDMQGVLTLRPYPVLHRRDGRALLLAGDGKRGADIPAALEGRLVTAHGYVQARGSIGMLVLEAPPVARDGPATPPARETLGRYRLTGEICDGKCAAGAMRPGTGLAHRACATLCLSGEIPAVFVTAAPVLGQSFLLIGGADGGPLPESLRRFIGLRVSLEGVLERRGGLLVFLAEPASVVAR